MSKPTSMELDASVKKQTFQIAIRTPRVADRYQQLCDFHQMCRQFDAAQQSGNYELSDRIARKILEAYLLSECDSTSSKIAPLMSGVSLCCGTNKESRVVRPLSDRATMGRAVKDVESVETVEDTSGWQNGQQTSVREYLPIDLFGDLRAELENYLSSRINTKTIELPHMNGNPHETEDFGSWFNLEQFPRAEFDMNQSSISSSAPLEASQCEHQVLLTFSDILLESVPACIPQAAQQGTEVGWDTRLAVEVGRALKIKDRLPDRTVAVTPTSKIPHTVGSTSSHIDLNTNIDMGSADSSSLPERLRQLHPILTQFTWAQTLFNQASHQCARNPMKPDAILDDHLTRVWRDRARVMTQEDELDGLPSFQLPNRRTRRSGTRSRWHPWNKFTQPTSGSRWNTPGESNVSLEGKFNMISMCMHYCRHSTRKTQSVPDFKQAIDKQKITGSLESFTELGRAPHWVQGVLQSEFLNRTDWPYSISDVEIKSETQDTNNPYLRSYRQYQARCTSSAFERNEQRNFCSSGKPRGGGSIPSAGVTTAGHIVIYNLPDAPLPHFTYWPRRQPPTLGQFKQIVWERFCRSPSSTELIRLWRYFFKCTSDEFSPGVVYQECTLSTQRVPLWNGHVWAKIEMDD
ncbi:hypothetical protein EG68_06601 [Paragonimus skrjabini miyazakii]|uniref:DIX domain-containing protein n=1 Tax=Paragonimus skrjabini miyazakii TaxID=59628 RepID=A0A8S9Z0S0_9TREM|nr:hypothetical protein EG68_06601 [Paragonimus skrjabini miyazakii]